MEVHAVSDEKACCFWFVHGYVFVLYGLSIKESEKQLIMINRICKHYPIISYNYVICHYYTVEKKV